MENYQIIEIQPFEHNFDGTDYLVEAEVYYENNQLFVNDISIISPQGENYSDVYEVPNKVLEKQIFLQEEQPCIQDLRGLTFKHISQERSYYDEKLG